MPAGDSQSRPMTFAETQAVLGELAALGPFFAVESHRPGQLPREPWRPIAELTTPAGLLRGRIRAVRRGLAEQAGLDADQVELRVAASIAHLGLVARLAGPAIAVAAIGYRLDLRPGRMWWQDLAGGPVPLSVPAWSCLSHGTAMDEPVQLIEQLVAPLTAAVADLVPISRRVLWGNVASAVNGAAVEVARQRPDVAGRAWLAATAVFAHRNLGQERSPSGPGFCRSSCCLRYRLPGADVLCGDCVLAPAARQRTPEPR